MNQFSGETRVILPPVTHRSKIRNSFGPAGSRAGLAFLAGLLLCAQTPVLPGFPPGTFQNRAALDAAPVTYQGPGDIVSGAIAWGSCARVYNVSLASTSTSLCDLVAVTGGATVCTLRGSSTGFVDLAASYCAGTTPAAACAAASGGSCKVSQVYDQTGTGNHFTQGTLANMPAITFSLLNGLPGLTYAAGNAVLASPSITRAQPFSLSAVWIRTANNTTAMTAIGAASNAITIGPHSAINTARANAGSSIDQTATDNAWHSHNFTVDNTASGANLDGTDSGNAAGGILTFGSAARIGRSNGAVTMTGSVMEAGLWPSAFTATQRGNMSTNQHSAANGYNF